jgi:ATP-binding cassette subfamily B protein
MVAAVLLVGRGDLDVAEAGAALVAVRLLGSRVGGASLGLSHIFEASLFLEDLDAFRRRVGDGGSAAADEKAPQTFREIQASDLTFTYPDAPRPAVDGVSLSLRCGEVIALVGENGSGKTTLAKLLGHLYEPDTGTVLWDGIDVRRYEPSSVRRRIAVLFQDFVRYRFTARTNIAIGRSDEEVAQTCVEEVATQARAHDFLSGLPAGYETVLSKEFAGGTELSLGQWQRVALARALLRDAPLVILDEPSASLDARAEHEFFERVRSLFEGRTLLLISHRLSTVRAADRIYVLEEGKLVESGSHDALIKEDGVYARLFRLQAEGYGPAVTDA